MKENKKIIDTNEELLKNLNENQKKFYYEYRSKLTNVDDTMALMAKEDMQIAKLENTYEFLKKALKVEACVAVIACIGIFVFSFARNNINSTETYSPVATKVVEFVNEDNIA